MTQPDCNRITQQDNYPPVAVASGQDKPRKGLSLLMRPDAASTVKEIASGLSRCQAKTEQFSLTLEALPSWEGAPPIIRLRKFLKAAIRSYGLKCTECRETTPPIESKATSTPIERQT